MLKLEIGAIRLPFATGHSSKATAILLNRSVPKAQLLKQRQNSQICLSIITIFSNSARVIRHICLNVILYTASTKAKQSAMGVDKDTAARLLRIADELGGDLDTVKLSGDVLANMNSIPFPSKSGGGEKETRYSATLADVMLLYYRPIYRTILSIFLLTSPFLYAAFNKNNSKGARRVRKDPELPALRPVSRPDVEQTAADFHLSLAEHSGAECSGPPGLMPQRKVYRGWCPATSQRGGYR